MPFLHRASAGVLICIVLGILPSPGGVRLAAQGLKEEANELVKPSRELMQSFKLAQDAAAQGRYADAVANLRKIMDPAVDDGFLSLEKPFGLERRTIKSEAVRLLDALPSEGRQIYEIQCDAAVGPILEAALRRSNRAALAEIALSYFPSHKAADVAMLLAHDAFDRCKPLESLAWLRHIEKAASAAKSHEMEISLLRAACYLSMNDPRRARESLAKLKAINPPATFRLGAEKYSTADPPDRLLSRLGGEKNPAVDSPAAQTATNYWPMYRGDATRNGSAAWTGPLGEKRWKTGTLDRPEMLQFRSWKRTDPHNDIIPCSYPLVVGNLLLARSPRRLAAFDLSSGKLLWENPPVDKSDKSKEAAINSVVWQRFWEDAPYGQISSNGSEVFLLDGENFAQFGNAVPRMVAFRGQGRGLGPQFAPPCNRLVSLSLRQQGKSLWAVGDEEGGQEPKLSGCCFLGPPLPHERKLYILAEKDDTIRLCVLDSASGRLEWSIALAQAESPIDADPVRRLAGASPSLSDGIILCPTSAGAVVAVDPTTRSLLWGFGYPVVESLERGPNGPVLCRIGPQNNSLRPRTVRDCDASAVLAAGRTILMPVESDRIFCLDTAKGELLWSGPRGETFCIIAATAENVILAGENCLYALSLQDGKVSWRGELPGKSVIAGRGFRSGNFYYLPSTWNELLKFDLETGRIAQRSPAKSTLGNLTAAGNLLISHTGDAVQVFAAGEVEK